MFHGLWIQMRWLWESRRNTDGLQWETLSLSHLPVSKTCPSYKTFDPTYILLYILTYWGLLSLCSWVYILESNLGITENFEGAKKWIKNREIHICCSVFLAGSFLSASDTPQQARYLPHSCSVLNGIEVLAFVTCIARRLKRSLTLTGETTVISVSNIVPWCYISRLACADKMAWWIPIGLLCNSFVVWLVMAFYIEIRQTAHEMPQLIKMYLATQQCLTPKDIINADSMFPQIKPYSFPPP